MKKNFFIFKIGLIWFTFIFLLLTLSKFAPFIIKQRSGFLGPSPFANFDGKHYLSISEIGYSDYEQAFFPLFPLFIKYTSFIFKINNLIAATGLIYLFFFLALLYFYKLLKLDYDEKTVFWSILFLLSFPTAFFLGSIYTESLFLFFIFSSIYYARKEKFIAAVLLGSLASATRILGILIILPIFYEVFLFYKEHRKNTLLSKFNILILPFFSTFGIFSYILFLYKKYHDPLLFIHVQPFFGANRSGGRLIFIFQVLYRYIKIFLTVPINNYDLFVSIFEFSVFLLVIYLLYFSYKQKSRISYILFSLFAILIPTLSGTLSSIPRYALVSFSIFPVLARIESFRLRLSILTIFLILEFIAASLFLRGYFIS